MLEVMVEIATEEVEVSTVASKIGPGSWLVLEFGAGDSEDVSLWCKSGFEMAMLLIPSLYKHEESAIVRDDDDTTPSFRCLSS